MLTMYQEKGDFEYSERGDYDEDDEYCDDRYETNGFNSRSSQRLEQRGNGPSDPSNLYRARSPVAYASSDVASSSASNSFPNPHDDAEHASNAFQEHDSTSDVVNPSDVNNEVVEYLSGNGGNQESQIGEQAKILLNLFIQHHARETPVEPIVHHLCNVDRSAMMLCGLTDQSTNKIMNELHKIADVVGRNEETIEELAESVPVCSTKDVFFDVVAKVFADGTVNWGRIVMVFYFGCKLVMRSLNLTSKNAGWVKQMLAWLVDFVTQHFARWIVNQGGWAMIKEWAKFTDNVWMILFFGSLIFGLWAYFRKT